MKRKQFLILIILLVIGFASVSTTIILKGNVGVGVELDDFDVIFTEALLDGKEDSKATISKDKKTITFTTDKFINKGDSARLDYKVKNTSTQYDADVTINCTNEANEYVTVTSSFDGNTIPLVNPVNIQAQEVKNGYINAELTKAYAGEDTSIEIKCSIVFTATSRDTYAYTVNFNSNGGSEIDDKSVTLNGSYGELATPTREGYTFLGWYDENDNQVDEDTILDSKGNKTLYAKWSYICPYNSGQVWEFDYTGGEQSFTVPCDGNYKLETWGAQGGTANSIYAIGGYGAFAQGTIFFNKDKKIYVNVGGMGKSNNNSTTIGAVGGYNGGGSCGYVPCSIKDCGNVVLASGGGATHISEKTGTLNSLESIKDQILIVSGGGGAGSFHDNYGLRPYGNGGNAGGINGNSGQINNSAYTYGYGGTQNSGGGSSKSISVNGSGFGYGAYSSINQGVVMSGGGSGYYGGGAGFHAGGGGSSYIGNSLLTDKVMYCYNCQMSNEVSTKTISTTCTSSTPTSNCAKQSNGYAKITLVSID